MRLDEATAARLDRPDDPILEWADLIWGDGTGWACVAFREAGGNGMRHESFPWPSGRSTAAARIAELAPEHDVWGAVLLRTDTEPRNAGNAAPGRWTWSDADEKQATPERPEILRTVRHLAVLSGTGSNLQVYVPLDRDYPPDKLSRASARLIAAIGSDPVQDTARVLRIPGTLNHKRCARGGHQCSPVRWAADPSPLAGYSHPEFAALFPEVTRTGSGPLAAEPEPEPLPHGLTRYERQTIRTSDPDPSKHTYAVICAAVRAGRTDGQIVAVLEQDLVTQERWAAGPTKRKYDLLSGIPRARAEVAAAERHPADQPRIREEPVAESSPECTDVGNGDRFVRDHRDLVRHVEGLGWLFWDGRVWRRDTKHVRELAKRTARGIYGEAGAQDTDRARELELARWAYTSQSSQRIDAMLKMASSVPEVSLEVAALDARPFLLTAGNGTIGLRTGVLRPFSQDDLITCGTPIDYYPGAPCPMWDRWLKWFCQGDAGLAEWYQLWAGFTLTGSTGAQCWILLYGQGSNGKTTFINTLAGLLGQLARPADAEMLSKARGQGGHSDALARLAGARMIYLSETGKTGRWDEPLIKQLTGGDPISASFKGQGTFEFVPQLTLWAFGNSKPRFEDTSDGWWRRVKLVQQTVKVQPAVRIPDYHKVLLAKEGPGILAWAVRGAVRAAEWLESGGALPEPQAVQEATEEYRRDSDQLGRFLRSTLRLDPGAWISQSSLLMRYQRSGGDARSQIELAREVVAWFAEKDRDVRLGTKTHGVRVLLGVRYEEG